MSRPPHEQRAHVEDLARRLARESNRPDHWPFACGIWQSVYDELWHELETASQRIDLLEAAAAPDQVLKF